MISSLIFSVTIICLNIHVEISVNTESWLVFKSLRISFVFSARTFNGSIVSLFSFYFLNKNTMFWEFFAIFSNMFYKFRGVFL